MALALLPALRRAGIRLRLVASWRHPAVRRVLRLSGWTAGYVASNQLALWLVLVLANAHRGGVSAYQAAFVFFQLPHGLVAVSLMTTLAPDLASAAGKADAAAFRERFTYGLRLMSVAILPAAAGYLVLSRPIVSFLLERGALSSASAGLTASCVVAFSLGLLPFSLYLFALRGFYARQDTRTPFLLNAFENGLNIVLALALEPWLGVKGLALAYSLAYGVAAVVALSTLRRRTGGSLLAEGVASAVGRMAVAAAVMAVVVRLATAALPGDAPAALEVAVGVLVGVPVYAGALSSMRVRDLEAVRRFRDR
jgi:putative peptidoglycan lipid II flippase